MIILFFGGAPAIVQTINPISSFSFFGDSAGWVATRDIWLFLKATSGALAVRCQNSIWPMSGFPHYRLRKWFWILAGCGGSVMFRRSRVDPIEALNLRFHL